MPTVDDVNKDLQAYKAETNDRVNQVALSLEGVKVDVKVLKEDDAKYKGLVAWFEEKVMNNPKVSVVLSLLSGILLTWATTNLPQYFSTPPADTVNVKKVEEVKGLPTPPQ